MLFDLCKSRIHVICLPVFTLIWTLNLHAMSIPETSAKAVAVYDLTSKQWLYSKNATRRLPPASIVKLLTAMVVLDHFELNRKIKIPSSRKTNSKVQNESCSRRNLSGFGSFIRPSDALGQ